MAAVVTVMACDGVGGDGDVALVDDGGDGGGCSGDSSGVLGRW